MQYHWWADADIIFRSRKGFWYWWEIILSLYWYYDHWLHWNYSDGRFSSLSLTIKIEQNFDKLSILTESILSKEKKHLASYQLAMNQVYQNRIGICQVINLPWIKTIKIKQTFGKGSILTESIIPNLGVINLSVVWFHLVHFSVQVSTWWWSKSSRGLIGRENIFIGSFDIVALVGLQTWTTLLSWQHLSFLPIISSYYSSHI